MVKHSSNAPVTADATKGGRKRAPENETPRQRFVRIASIRLQNTLDGLRTLGDIGKSSEYEYTQADTDLIGVRVNKALTDALASLANKGPEKVTPTLFD